MGWILMQPADDADSVAAARCLKETGNCLFDISLGGARLKPVAFGSRGCNDNEQNFHSFTGESACGRWAITQNKKYLWGCHFYWLCDCCTIKEILEYSGSIPMICRWAQELLGYQFSVIHRNKRVMIDVDALTRRFGSIILSHCAIAEVLSLRDTERRHIVYSASMFHICATSVSIDTATTTIADPILLQPYVTPSFNENIKIPPSNQDLLDEDMLLDVDTDDDACLGSDTCSVATVTLSSSPILFFDSSTCTDQNTVPSGVEMKITTVAKHIFSTWLCADDIYDSLSIWCTQHIHISQRWDIVRFFLPVQLSICILCCTALLPFCFLHSQQLLIIPRYLKLPSLKLHMWK